MSILPNLGRLAEAALALVEDGFVMGLGSGHAAEAFVRALGRRVAEGLRVRGVPTSESTRRLALELGIPLVTLDEIESIDLTVDGADEVDPQLNLIKGLGGALVREKIVAASSRRLVILVGREKIVAVLGQHGVLPVEVVPFALPFCRRRLAELGYPGVARGAGAFLTDNGNYVLDCHVPRLPDPAQVERSLRSIPGIVGTGLFLGMAETVLVGDDDQIQVLTRQ